MGSSAKYILPVPSASRAADLLLDSSVERAELVGLIRNDADVLICNSDSLAVVGARRNFSRGRGSVRVLGPGWRVTFAEYATEWATS